MAGLDVLLYLSPWKTQFVLADVALREISSSTCRVCGVRSLILVFFTRDEVARAVEQAVRLTHVRFDLS